MYWNLNPSNFLLKNNSCKFYEHFVTRDGLLSKIIWIYTSKCWIQIPPLLSEVVDKVTVVEICLWATWALQKTFGIGAWIQLSNLFSFVIEDNLTNPEIPLCEGIMLI